MCSCNKSHRHCFSATGKPRKSKNPPECTQKVLRMGKSRVSLLRMRKLSCVAVYVWKWILVEDSAVTPSSIVAAEKVVEQEGEHTLSSSRCPSRQSSRSVGGDTDSEEDDDKVIPAKKSKEETPLVARVDKKKGKQTGATQFLVAFGELQEQAQMRQQ